MARWVKGESGNPAGKKKGCKNQFTRIRDDILQVWHKLGGAEGLYKWALEDSANKRDFYKIAASLLPKNIHLQNESDIQINVISFRNDEKKIKKADAKVIETALIDNDE